MEVDIENRQEVLSLSLDSVPLIAKTILKEEKIHTDEFAVYFISQKEISSLHQTFFDDPTPTDCISFPMDQEKGSGYHFLGEIFVCPETAVLYCHQHGGDPNEETTLYLVHGLLHLIGYDDIEEKEEKIMREKEKKYMTKLKKQNLLL